jgi:hypothetical protein
MAADCVLFHHTSQWPKVLNAPLANVDPELFDIIEKEKNRQYKVGERGLTGWKSLQRPPMQAVNPDS